MKKEPITKTSSLIIFLTAGLCTMPGSVLALDYAIGADVSFQKQAEDGGTGRSSIYAKT